MNNTLFGFSIFFAIVILLQIFNRKAILKLSVEEKARLLDYSSGAAIWRLVPIVLLIAGYAVFNALPHSQAHFKTGLVVYFVLLLLSAGVSRYFIQRKYRQLGFPADYIRTMLISNIITMVLVTAFFAWILFPIFHMHAR